MIIVENIGYTYKGNVLCCEECIHSCKSSEGYCFRMMPDWKECPPFILIFMDNDTMDGIMRDFTKGRVR